MNKSPAINRFLTACAVPFLFGCMIAPAGAQTIDPERLRSHVEVLASDPMEGRLAGTIGARRAAEFIAAKFAEVGLQPTNGGYLRPFEFTAGVTLADGNRLALPGASPVAGKDWTPLAFSKTGTVHPAEVVFVGYGITATDGLDYDSFGAADVSGKWVLAWRGVPLDAPLDLRVQLARYSALRYKASLAKAKGAAGLIIAPAPGVRYSRPLPSTRFDGASDTGGLPVIAIDMRLTETLLAELGPRQEPLRDALLSGQVIAPESLGDLKIGAEIALTKQRRQGLNVVGHLDLGGAPDEPPLIVGAHFDHLGSGETSSSLAHGEEQLKIHRGADDNASSVAALIEIAALMARNRPAAKRNILFVAFSGEELGLLGSSAFVQDAKASAYLNMDMVGRLRTQLQIAGFGSSRDWAELIDKVEPGAPFEIRRDPSPYVPTDATSFYQAGVPVLSFTTGAHPDYHTPRDLPETLNYQGLAEVSELIAKIAGLTARAKTAPSYTAGAAPADRPARRRAAVALGTIPAYGGENQAGVPISATVDNGPAQIAGLQGGDVIVGLAGTQVADIYDFMRVLNGLRPDEAVPIIVKRGERRFELTITPVARDDR